MTASKTVARVKTGDAVERRRQGDDEAPNSPAAQPPPPSAHPALAGPENGHSTAVAGAVAALVEAPTRDPATGRFVPGNAAALRHGGRSRRLPGALAAAKRELLSQVCADLALDSNAAATLTGLADLYCEVTLLRAALFSTLSAQGGAVTGKGNTRAAVGVYLTVADRELRLAQALGLERKQRAVAPLDAVRAAVEAAQHTTPPSSPACDLSRPEEAARAPSQTITNSSGSSTCATGTYRAPPATAGGNGVP